MDVKEGRGSPYSIKNYEKVSPEYGTLQDLRQLVDKSHKLGMAVIMDWVGNHTSWDNAWIKNKSWYTQNEQGEIIHPATTDWTDVADLNYDNKAMQTAMINAMKYWFKAANIDGYRVDAADFVPINFWAKAITELRNANKGRRILMLAEGNLQDYYGAGFDMDYGWNFYERTKELYADSTYSYGAYFDAYAAERAAGEKQIHFTTNHDKSAWEKTDVQLFNGERGAMSAFVLTTMLAGKPLIYSTQEIGYETVVPFFSCTEIDWDTRPAIFAEYKKIMEIYTSSDVFKRGEIEDFREGNAVCFTRSYGDKTILVAVNVRNRYAAFQIPAKYTIHTHTFVDLMSNTEISAFEDILLKPYGYMIVELK